MRRLQLAVHVTPVLLAWDGGEPHLLVDEAGLNQVVGLEGVGTADLHAAQAGQPTSRLSISLQ